MLRASAIEENLADKFVRGLAIVEKTAKVVPSIATPQIIAAMSAAGAVLSEFQVSDTGTTNSKGVPFNPTSGDVIGQTQAFLFVPTGGISSRVTWTIFKGDGPACYTETIYSFLDV